MGRRKERRKGEEIKGAQGGAGGTGLSVRYK